MRFLGVPLFVWGALCLLIAVIFTLVVPQQMNVSTGVRFFLLRWGHALVWLLLALLFFARGANLGGPVQLLGLAAGLLYAAFLMALVTRKSLSIR
ncbi:MAG TPA: hypothetical protein VIL85_17510 [Thermomicrobiales bacterium]